MVMVLIFALAFALHRSTSETARNAWAVVRGRERQPRPAPVDRPTRPAWMTRGAGQLLGWLWAVAAEWEIGWRTGIYRRNTGGPWQPWRQWDPPAVDPTPTSDGAAPGPAGPTPAGGPAPTPGATEPTAPTGPGTGAGRPTGRPHAYAPPDGGVPKAETVDTEPAPTMKPAGAQSDDDILPGHPMCWSDLEPDQQAAVAAAAEARHGEPWRRLDPPTRAAAVAEWIAASYGVELTGAEVLDAQQPRRGDSTWHTGVPCPECAAEARDGRLIASDDPAAHSPDCPVGRFWRNRNAGYTGWLDQDGYRVDEHGTRLDDQDGPGPVPDAPRCWSQLTSDEQQAVVAAAEAWWQRPWDTLTPRQRTAAVGEWINKTYRAGLTVAAVTDAQAAYDDPTWLTDTPHDPGPATGPAHDPAALAPGTPDGGADMTVTSGETTNITNARTYYGQLGTHADDQIAAQVEVSRSYFTASQLKDPAVFAAVAEVEETARLLGAKARAVIAALDAHRLMEEAVAATPGAANTDFYRQA